MYAVLSNDLLAALKSYLASKRAGSSLSEPLAVIISAMEKQAPSSISEADGAIANAAEMWSWQPKPIWWRRFCFRGRHDLDLLFDNPELAYLFIFHRNGFIRQAALDQIEGPIPNAFLVAALAWRLNDWVPQVRESALACAFRCLPRTGRKPLADFFFETVRPRTSWGRWTGKEQEVLNAAIKREEVKEQVVTNLVSTRNGPLPSFLSYLLRYSWIDPFLPVIASNSIVPGVRAIALRSLIKGSARYTDGTVWRWIDKPMGIRTREPKVVARPLTVESDPKALIQEGLIDKSAVVRREALSGIIEFSLYNSFDDAVIQRCTDDASASVRSRASFVRKKIAEWS